jgi:hypothetical protein
MPRISTSRANRLPHDPRRHRLGLDDVGCRRAAWSDGLLQVVTLRRCPRLRGLDDDVCADQVPRLARERDADVLHHAA